MSIAAERRCTILVIDDDQHMHAFLAALLDDKASVLCAGDGASGIEQARSATPDLILLDYLMPGMDGIDVCATLKSNPATAAIPILFLTAYDCAMLEVRALEAGAADFLCKPLRTAVVRARIDTQLALLAQTAVIRSLAQRDTLTDLFNRRYFDAQVQAELLRHQRQRQPMAVAMVDVDHFKGYNDSLGHQRGDECLCQIAQALRERMRRPGEIVARYGGEEFAVLIPACDPDNTARYGEWIRAAVEDLQIPHPDSAASAVVTVSVGVASLIPSESTSVKIIMALADMGLYAAKRAGRNGHHLLQG